METTKYEPPQVEQLGSVYELTAASGNGALQDGTFIFTLSGEAF